MMPLQSLLAAEWLRSNIQYLPLAVVILCGVILLIAFFVGLKKGGRRVSWGGFVWLAAGVAFFLVDKYLGAKNPVRTWLTKNNFDGNVVAFASSFTIAIACIIVVLALYGLFTLLFRRGRKFKKEKDLSEERGVKYGTYEDVEIYGDEEEKPRGKYRKPSVFGRICGGLICVVNTAMVLAVVIAAALLLVNSTSFKDGFFSPIYRVPLVRTLVTYASRFALDFAIIGIIAGIACAGTKKGMLETVRALLVKLGVLAALGFSFYLPFSKFVDSNAFLSAVVERCIALFNTFGASEKVATIGGKVLSGVALAVVSCLAILLVQWILKQIVKVVNRLKFLQVIDRTLSCVLYLAIGVAVCAAIWAVVYTLAYYGIFQVSELMTGDTCLSNGIFQTFDVYLKPYLDSFTETAKTWMAKLPF